MLDAMPITADNVISLARVRAQRAVVSPLRAQLCSHCGAALGEGENEDECSSAGFSAMPVAAVRRRAE